MASDIGHAKKTLNNKKADEKVVKLQKLETSKIIKKEVINPDELVFALDIGTRSVVGVAALHKEDRFDFIATEVIEHKNRAMLDGQIHDIEQVTQVVLEVKRRIEASLGLQLKKVSIAAAGRVLKTTQVKLEREADPDAEIDQDLVSSLEIEGIQKAQLALDEDMSSDEKAQFYCVGYSVISYYLNRYPISKLLGHKGKNIGAEIIATFLPHIVVNSLYTVMERVGLEVSSLTLEPIAAINVAIPQDLRLLNLALVDIGAGTSDIALTRDGSVIAFAMVPMAGDEITEAISRHYLVDFNTAEKIKVAISSGKEDFKFVDILNNKQSIKTSDIMAAIRQAIELLADTISYRILEINGKAPNAVFLIGGGSQIAGISDMISEKLGLPKDRVVVRNRDIIKDVKFNDKKLSGPESVTPYGIAITSQLYKGKDFLFVTVNEKKIKLFNRKKLTVADALVLTGFNPGNLIGRSGKSLSFVLNDENKFIRGEFGKAAEITVNNFEASLDTLIRFGDDIKVVPASDGASASIKLLDLTSADEADDIDEIIVNGKKEELDYNVKNNDIIEIIYWKHTYADTDTVIEVPQNQTPKCETGGVVLTVNGEKITMKESKSQHIFVDVFSYIHFDLTKPKGNIVLRLNGQAAAFTDIVKSGDIIEIFWQK